MLWSLAQFPAPLGAKRAPLESGLRGRPYRERVYRFLVTPRWWGINIFAVLAIPVCLLMGSWQLGRFDARIDNQRVQDDYAAEARHAKPEPLSSLLPVTAKTAGRTAEVRGTYDTGRPLLVPGRTLDGKDGTYALSLLRVGKGEGKAIPVVRGWLPGEPKAADVPPMPSGEVTVKGVLQASESQDAAGRGASGALPQGQLGFISAAGLVNRVPYDVDDAWLTVQHTEKPLKPVPPVAPDNTGLDMKAFQNLGYTAEWFAFAGFVIFMWFRLFRREREIAKDIALGLIPEPSAEEPSAEAPSEDSADDAGRNRSPAAPA